MRISRCGLPPIHNKGLAFRNGGGAMIEAFLLEIIYLLFYNYFIFKQVDK